MVFPVNLGIHAREQSWAAVNFYDMLGIARDASEESIREAAARRLLEFPFVNQQMEKCIPKGPAWAGGMCEEFRERIDLLVEAYGALQKIALPESSVLCEGRNLFRHCKPVEDNPQNHRANTNATRGANTGTHGINTINCRPTP